MNSSSSIAKWKPWPPNLMNCAKKLRRWTPSKIDSANWNKCSDHSKHPNEAFMKRTLLGITLLTLVSFLARSQSYEINWYKIAGGGGVSTNDQYSLSGTIGQPDA